jgi:hypothetical protein
MTTLTTLTPYSGVVPNRAIQDDNARALAVFNFLQYAGVSLVTDINTNFVSKINTLAGEIGSAAAQVAEDKNTIIEAKDVTVAAKNAVLNVASILPDGTINDSTINTLHTWSSEKINTELSNKADASSVLTADEALEEAYATALCF